MDEFIKDKAYMYKGEEVYINSLCPLDHCCDIFIMKRPSDGFCEWLTIDDARKYLK
jgi:hypothetical protein